MSIVNHLARQYAKFYGREMFIGVTGSVGKTICVTACSAVLSQKYKTLTTQPHPVPGVNIPSTILKLNPSFKKAVLEMGVENIGEMDSHLSLVKPKIVILTRVSRVHCEALGDVDEILQEIGKLVASLDQDGVVILNWHDSSSKKLAENCKGSVMYYGMDPQNCTIWAGNIKIENFATTFELNFGVERVKVNFKLLGLHQVYPVLAAALLGVVCDIPLTKIKLALESIEATEHQLQAVFGPNGSVLLDDSYNSSQDALDSAIDTLLAVPARRRVIVLGEMKGLGNYAEKLYRSFAQRIYKEKLDWVFLGQGDTQIIACELRSLGFWEEKLESNLQNSQLVSKLLQTLGKGDVCLIAGSKTLRLDEVVKRIAKK